MKHKIINIFILTLMITSCKKEATKIDEISTIDDNFFIMKSYENNSNQAFSSNSSKPNPTLIDSVVNELRIRDGIYKFSGKLVKQMGIPYWDYSMKLNNENGNHTLITPILDSNNSIENLIFSYQNKNKKLIVKIINKKSFQKNIPKYGNSTTNSFSTSTLNGIFEAMNFKIKKDITVIGNSKISYSQNIKKNSSVYVNYVCWYYISWRNGYYETTNTQCSYNLIITKIDILNLNDTWQAPDFDQMSGGGGGIDIFEQAEKIIIDSSILNNINIKCVFEAMSSSILKDILAGFSNNTKYNLIVSLDPSLPNNTTGRVIPDGYNIYLKINPNLIDNEYSKIWTASTILHEAFHAKLLLKVKEEFGDLYQDINKWPTPINDMELKELVDYYMQNSIEKNRWESANHDWMVRNIENMSNYSSQYVQKYYPSLYNPSNGLDPYKYLMYHGLQNSKFYDKNYVKKLDDYAHDLINTNCPQ
jgi:hypothetical protein